ncbi:MAG: hypothetical protein R3327_03980 [Nitrosopumilaceae archaeon]|nr:hypothetical protein [Nitrosopumilaceae archaeon]
MKFSDEQVRDMVSLKEQITTQINEHQKQIELLEKNLSVLDSILKQSSFTKASSLSRTHTEAEPAPKSEKKSIPITKGSGGEIIANAYVTPEQVSIVLDENIGIDFETPPFKSFFLDRIIGEMKRKDSQEASSGNIPNESIIDYVINKNCSKIREIIIRNYREKDRVNEIINTVGWSFTRMIENSRK